MTDAVRAGKSVRLYEKGYVRVGGAIFRSGASFERLLGISGSADVAKKTGLGRVAGFALTGGLNIMLTPNKRGDLSSAGGGVVPYAEPSGRTLRDLEKVARSE